MVETRISAIIPTFNRRHRLQKVLTALDRQADADVLEVVVVDDGSSDGTSDWLAAQSFSFSLTPLRQSNSGPAHARNAGVDAARSPLLLFIDDDVVPEPAFIREHLRSHEAGPDLVVIGPLASLAHYEQPWVAWEQAKLESQYAAMLRGDWAPTFRQFWTGNASVGRRHVIEAGKFDPTFLRGEDVELGLRLHERGLKFRFNPEARGMHHAERTLASWENAHRSYGRLEVQMLLPRGDDAAIDLLAGNWSRIHPGIRILTEFCATDPMRFDAATAALRRSVSLMPSRGRRVTDKALSVLANLLYWQSAFAELGPRRSEEVKRRGLALRKPQQR